MSSTTTIKIMKIITQRRWKEQSWERWKLFLVSWSSYLFEALFIGYKDIQNIKMGLTIDAVGSWQMIMPMSNLERPY